MTKWTAGPWRATIKGGPYGDRQNAGERPWNIVSGFEDCDEGARVCTLSDDFGTEGRVNARLIAAAPEMAEILDELVAEFDFRNDRLPEGSMMRDPDGIALARALLARINGEEK